MIRFLVFGALSLSACRFAETTQRPDELADQARAMVDELVSDCTRDSIVVKRACEEAGGVDCGPMARAQLAYCLAPLQIEAARLRGYVDALDRMNGQGEG